MDGTRMIRVEVTIPAYLKDELDRRLMELTTGGSARLPALATDVRAIELRATAALSTIARHVDEHDGTGSARRLVRFVAGLYNGEDYPFDLTELRGLDDALANACLDYLNYDRLGLTEVHTHLAGGAPQLQRWLERYGIRPNPVA